MTTSEQAMLPFNDGGLSNVFLSNGYTLIEDPYYGVCESYEDIFALTRQVAVALALRPGRLRGLEFQYIRKAMHWPRTEVAKRFARTELTIANWESRNKVPLEASLLLKQNCLHHFDLEEQLGRTLDQQGNTDFSDEQIVMQRERGTWRSNFHPVQIRSIVIGQNMPTIRIGGKPTWFVKALRANKEFRSTPPFQFSITGASTPYADLFQAILKALQEASNRSPSDKKRTSSSTYGQVEAEWSSEFSAPSWGDRVPTFETIVVPSPATQQ